MSIGQITVDLLAKTGSFETDLGRASKSAQKRAKEIDASFQAAGRAIGAGLAVMAGAAVVGLNKYFQNTVEAEKVQAQLAARIKDTGGAAQQSIESLNRMADSMSKLTVFDDEAIGGVQAMLLTFKDIRGANFEAATGAVLDLATAMGTDLNSAALQVGKALNDPIKGVTALAKAGVQFTDEQKKLIKSFVDVGDVAKAQQVILRELEGQMGSAAEAARDTLGGSLQALQNSFDNLLEGDAGSGGLVGARDAVESLIKTFNDPSTKQGIDTMASGLLRLGNAAIVGGREVAGFLTQIKETLTGESLGDTADQIIRLREHIAMREKVSGAGSQTDLRRQLDDLRLKYAKEQANAPIVATGDRFSAAYEAAALNFNPNPSRSTARGTSASIGTKRRTAAEAVDPLRDFAADLVKIQAKMQASLEGGVEKQMESAGEWAKLTAQLEGPLKEAELSHIERMLDIERLGKLAGASSAEIARLKGLEAEGYKKAAAAMQEQAAAAANPKLVEGMDALRQAGYDFLVDLPRGGLDNWKDMLDNLTDMLTRWAAKGLIDQLFGGAGTTGAGTAGGDWIGRLFGGGSNSGGGWLSKIFGSFTGMSSGGGGWLSSIFGGGSTVPSTGFAGSFGNNFGWLFGGARAGGGSVWPDSAFLVGERGPELFVPRSAGTVLPANVTRQAAQGGPPGVVNFHNSQHFNGLPGRQTMQQSELEIGRAARRAMARTGR
ncbi:phage tail length tape measure family protein [Lysobacter antibioticus]|uniref:phage tail length tape measure family protein n=1 Tax=Lysobacter antibioticus TaxID=84531 RepID=UPI00034D2E19|nr:phage tail length tape measure family protein [Lysobacter antibioticus]